MTVMVRRSARVAASSCAPFLVQAILLVLVDRAGPGVEPIAAYFVFVSAAAGFVWLALELGIYAFAVAVLYFPAMVIALVGFSIAFSGWLHHDSL